MTINFSVLKVVKIHQHAKFQAIPTMCSPGNARKPPIWPISLSQSDAKRRKSTDQYYDVISSEGAQDTPTCKISDHSLYALSSKWPETSPDGRTDRRTDRRTDMPQNGQGWSDGPTDPCTGEKRLFQASDGLTDGRTDDPKHNASGA